MKKFKKNIHLKFHTGWYLVNMSVMLTYGHSARPITKMQNRSRPAWREEALATLSWGTAFIGVPQVWPISLIVEPSAIRWPPAERQDKETASKTGEGTARRHNMPPPKGRKPKATVHDTPTTITLIITTNTTITDFTIP